MAITELTWDPVNDCVLEETDGNGGVKVTYTHEPSEWGPLLSEKRGTQQGIYHFDALGSTRAITDNTGTVTDTMTYDAWGNEVQQSGTSATTYRWVGRFGYQLDSSSVYSARSRSYAASLARWLSIDPLLLSPTSDDVEWTAYVYGNNRPVNEIDPSGLTSCAAPPFDLPPIDIPFPDFPSPVPAPPIELPPLEDLNKICLPCDAFTVDEWGEDLCNYNRNESIDSKKIQTCPCSSMKDANKPLTPAEIQAAFNNVLQELRNAGTLGMDCQVDVVVRAQCGPPGFAVACLNPGNNLGPHKICIPTSMPRCNIGGLIGHELIHAAQACENRFKGAKNKGGKKITCQDVEREAYAHNCKIQAKRDCIPPEPPSKRKKYIDACIKRGVRGSCNPKNVGDFSKLCKELFS